METAGRHGHKFRVLVYSNHCDTIISEPACLLFGSPLSFSTHPEDVVVCSGDPACFEVEAVNNCSGTLDYKWQYSIDGVTWFPTIGNSSNQWGGNTPTLCIADITGLDSIQYRCQINTNDCDFVYSEPALLIEEGPITFTDHPDDVSACAGESVEFCATAAIQAGNSGELQYQWQASSDGVNFGNLFKWRSSRI